MAALNIFSLSNLHHLWMPTSKHTVFKRAVSINYIVCDTTLSFDRLKLYLRRQRYFYSRRKTALFTLNNKPASRRFRDPAYLKRSYADIFARLDVVLFYKQMQLNGIGVDS